MKKQASCFKSYKDSIESNSIYMKEEHTGTMDTVELHPIIKLKAFNGKWSNNVNDDIREFKFSIYKLEFTSQNIKQSYSSIALLIEDPLDKDVAKSETILYVKKGKTVKAKIQPLGEAFLTSNQVEAAKAFQEIVCNGIVKTVLNNNDSNKNINIYEPNINKTLWNADHAYLLLPMVKNYGNGARLDWETINHCANVAKFFHPKEGNTSSKPIIGEINLNNGYTSLSGLIGKTIITKHLGHIHYVSGVLNMSIKSPFPSNGKKNYVTYEDYFHKRHGIEFQYKFQPLLQIKQCHLHRNLLRNRYRLSNCVVKISLPLSSIRKHIIRGCLFF